jgi:hypothetical protein
MRTKNLIAIFLLSCTALSCKKPTSANIIGRYTAERPNGFEMLELQTNGTYVQVFTNTTTARTNVGVWTLQPPTLTLKRALMFGAPSVATNDWRLTTKYVFNIWILGDGQSEAFSQVTADNQ